MAKQQRRLSELYSVGKELTLDDDSSKPVHVYLRKLNPVDYETAMRRANAARSRILAGRSEEAVDTRDTIYGDLAEADREDLLHEIALEDAIKTQALVEARIGGEEEWSEDGYLQGLRDSWEDELHERWILEPEDQECVRVLDELKRFSALVDEEIASTMEAVKLDWEHRDEEAIRNEVVKRRLQARADYAWLQEFRRCEVWLSVRELSDRRTHYFKDREEVNELASEVLIKLMNAYSELTLDPLEGKALPGDPASSNSSESAAEPETVESSGPEVVTV